MSKNLIVFVFVWSLVIGCRHPETVTPTIADQEVPISGLNPYLQDGLKLKRATFVKYYQGELSTCYQHYLYDSQNRLTSINLCLEADSLNPQGGTEILRIDYQPGSAWPHKIYRFGALQTVLQYEPDGRLRKILTAVTPGYYPEDSVVLKAREGRLDTAFTSGGLYNINPNGCQILKQDRQGKILHYQSADGGSKVIFKQDSAGFTIAKEKYLYGRREYRRVDDSLISRPFHQPFAYAIGDLDYGSGAGYLLEQLTHRLPYFKTKMNPHQPLPTYNPSRPYVYDFDEHRYKPVPKTTLAQEVLIQTPRLQDYLLIKLQYENVQ